MGVRDNLKMAADTARLLGCETDQVLTASTGVIGVPLDLGKDFGLRLPELIERRGPDRGILRARDLDHRLGAEDGFDRDLALSGGRVRLTGICKGSGMIHPNMGTMLGYFLTDLKLARRAWPRTSSKKRGRAQLQHDQRGWRQLDQRLRLSAR